MTILFSSLVGGGEFVASFASKTIEVSFGATGTVVTLTPPAGKKVKLTGLASSGAVHTNLITVSVGGNAIITDAKASQLGNVDVDVDELLIGFGNYNQIPITGKVGEAITIVTNVAMSQGLFYTYQFGE